jgi:ribonuclease R
VGAYAAVAKARDARSPLDLDLPERRIQSMPKGEITGITTKERLEAHRLIEEFMIQANVAAAETLERRSAARLSRPRHTVGREDSSRLRDFLQTLDMKWNVGNVRRRTSSTSCSRKSGAATMRA